MKKTVKVLITGSLQSMFFRLFIKDNAEANNIRGFLRKLEDNRIEVLIEGDSQDVDAMVEICREGPKHAIIRHVEVQEMPFQDFREFKIFNF